MGESQYDEISRRAIVKVDESIKETVDAIMKGSIVKVYDGNITKRIGHSLKDLRKNGMLTIAYDQMNGTSYAFLNEVPVKSKKRKWGAFGGRVWELIWGEKK